MSLPNGTRLGVYEIVSLLGAGGMGEVYRARDSKLGREVAIKILPEQFASDRERVLRFEREARTLASLNHPHIAQIYGLENSPAEGDGPAKAGPHLVALVMELVDGEDLSERIARGPIPLGEALAIAKQIADALDAAHGQGIVHRDLKPANVKVRDDGTVKVLDFGLAKGADSGSSSLGPSTVILSAMTVPGQVLGTAAYMSPEQARGRPVDKRADIWAFGCVLYELLTGRRAFEGETQTDLLVAILEREPFWQALPPDTSPEVRALIQRCLQKDRRERLRDIGDAFPMLLGTARAQPGHIAPRGARVVAAAAVAGLLIGAGGVWLALSNRDAPAAPGTSGPATVRFALPPPPGTQFGARISEIEVITVAMAPDGKTMAFIAARAGESARVWARPLAAAQAREIPGTEGATSLFWSPDASSLAFVVSGQLKRVAVAGGVPVKVCDVPAGVGVAGSWGRHGDILLASVDGSAISRVAASGGTPVEVVRADAGRVLWPHFLPDGRRFLYSTLKSGRGEIRLANVDGGSTRLLESISQAQWIDPDWLVFVREGTLLAQRVDLVAGRPSGDPVAILGSVAYSAATAWSNFSATAGGAIFARTFGNESQIAWFTRNGQEIGRVGDTGAYFFTLRLSPDDSSILFAKSRRELGTYDIWTRDLARATERRVTDSPGMETGETWLPDGRSIVYAAAEAGVPNLIRRDLASGLTQPLMSSPRFQFPNDVTADGATVIYQQRTDQGTWDLMQVSVHEPRRASPLVVSSGSEFDARLSPAGTQFSYSSDHSGRTGVYVSPFPPSGAPTSASPGGGTRARWRRDGRELFYLSPGRELMAVPIDAAGRPGAARRLFAAAEWLDFDVTRDGRFIAIVETARSGEQPLTVILNWQPGS